MAAEVEKRRLRELVTARRRALDGDWIEAASRAVQERAMALPEFAAARVVACYAALRGEVRTQRIVGRCWREGRRVCVPAREPGTGRYALLRWPPDGALARGALGVMEPVGAEWVRLEEIDFVAAPGVAFDRAGVRLGRGGGHYDRLLAGGRPAGARTPYRVGLAFDFQVFERIPREAHDVPMDAVVTESRIILPGSTPAEGG